MVFEAENTYSRESLEPCICMFHITDVISQVSDYGSDFLKKVDCEGQILKISATFSFASDMCYLGCYNCTWKTLTHLGSSACF